MNKLGSIGLLISLISFLGLSPCLLAGEITGQINVPKPDRAVVYLDAISGNFSAGHVTMDQKNKVFTPYVIPVVKGSTVEFHNGDNLQHNVFGVGAEEFNLGNFGQGMKA